jgi:hypothetical protein
VTRLVPLLAQVQEMMCDKHLELRTPHNLYLKRAELLLVKKEITTAVSGRKIERCLVVGGRKRE